MRRAHPVTALLLALGGITLLFVGCLHLTERTRHAQSELAPPRVVSVDRLIRVRLGGRSPREDATLELASGFTVTEAAAGDVLARQDGRLAAATVRPVVGVGIEMGGLVFYSDDILITPDRDACIILESKTYRGLLRIRRVDGGLVFDNHVDVESYLRGVLRGELPSYFHPESFKAQAVAARTYVLYQKENGPPGRSFDVFDHEGSQMYIGVRGEDTIAVKAVEGTCGEVCMWNDDGVDQIFCTYYSSTCGGCTQHVNNVKPHDPDVPPLAGNVPCNDCYLAKFYRWDPVKLSKAEVTKRLVARYPTISRLGTITSMEPKASTVDGRIIRLHLNGSTGQNETLIGEDFRLSIGGRTLKSTNFDIETYEDCFIFKNGRGFGHGIGLCQNGMETKARRGMGYEEILKTYYPGATIVKIY